jgi:hypothetical protein
LLDDPEEPAGSLHPDRLRRVDPDCRYDGRRIAGTVNVDNAGVDTSRIDREATERGREPSPALMPEPASSTMSRDDRSGSGRVDAD